MNDYKENSERQVAINPEKSGVQIAFGNIVEGQWVEFPIAVRFDRWSKEEWDKAYEMIETKLKELNA